MGISCRRLMHSYSGQTEKKAVRQAVVLAWKPEIDGLGIVCNGGRSTEFPSGGVSCVPSLRFT